VTRFRDLPGETDRTWHPQVHISHGAISALVDTKIAPLILALWRHGIATQASCQGDRERMATISFCSGLDADQFVALVKPWRLACQLHPDQHPSSPNGGGTPPNAATTASVFTCTSRRRSCRRSSLPPSTPTQATSANGWTSSMRVSAKSPVNDDHAGN
jgi:hypothetical protein